MTHILSLIFHALPLITTHLDSNILVLVITFLGISLAELQLGLAGLRNLMPHLSGTPRLPTSLALKSVRPNVISGGQLRKCGDLLEIEIYYNKRKFFLSFLSQKLCFHFRKALAGASRGGAPWPWILKSI